MHDLVVRGGTVVDGTGAPARTADVAVDDGRITAVGSLNGVAARQTIDADGALVTPGWVDIHTHYDGQATWDEVLAPSAWHGVTTIVTGNCGVGFAPARPDRHDWLIGLMEGVEDIPGTALAEGMSWDWESFPEYLDALDRRRFTVDVGTQIAHGAVRAYVMGERGARNEPAGPEDIEAMRAIVKEAVAAGALGFSTSRTIAHRAIDGEPVPGTYAAEDELFGIGAALGELGTGIFELAPTGVAGEDVIAPAKEVDWMRRLSVAIGRPVTFALLQIADAPDLWRDLMDESLRAADEGAQLWPQVAARATGLLDRTAHLVLPLRLHPRLPGAQGPQPRATKELIGPCRDPSVRESIVSFQPEPDHRAALERAYAVNFVLGTPPDYEPSPENSLASIAAVAGRHPLEVAYEVMLEDDGHGLLYFPILNYASMSLEPVREMLLHPRSVAGLGDGGAHCGVICDSPQPTFMLSHWTRDRTRGDRLPLEWVVKKQTHDTAAPLRPRRPRDARARCVRRCQRHRLRAPATRHAQGRHRPSGRGEAPGAGGCGIPGHDQVRDHHVREREGDRARPGVLVRGAR